MSKMFHSLRVKEVVKETSDTATLVFEIPQELTETFQYTQGQYLTLRLSINGKEQRRSYSMCSSPLEKDIAVTVKRVKNGVVSNYLNDRVQAGNMLDVMEPEGRFFTPLDPDNRKTYYLFGAGSGITPLFSILKTALEQEPQSFVHLLYGNRSEDSIIFKNQLDALQRRYDGQFTVDYILSKPKRDKPGGLAGLFSKGTLSWQGKTGRINAVEVNKFLEEHPLRNKNAEYFICGPGDLIDAVEKSLLEKGIDKKHIHAERFVSTHIAEADRIQGVGGAEVAVQLNGKTVSINVPAGKTILDVLIDKKHNPPYSCTSGACSTCIAKVTEGSVKMDVCYALDEDEVAQGFILTCQAHPTTPKVAVTFDV
ncbi:MAG: ferredoxin--NADP reductase [Saprospiraceae bacterium]|nr:ferredoxin--NADP reductase [Saprospiraceae bacterium]HRF41377.1 ferredoxin--NADP reductase [Saprospiraceae bacterium]HRK80956.1 ferredoxin--NADP reductase [Saprospiraceae bacterium]